MKRIFVLLRNIEQSPSIFAKPFFWALISSLFDGVSVGLFVPILKGIMDGSFAFLHDYPMLARLMEVLPLNFERHSLIRPLLFFGAAFIFFFSAKMLCYYCAAVSSARCAESLSHRIREASFVRCINLGKMFFDSRESGQLHMTIVQFSSHLGWKLGVVLNQVAQLLPIIFYFMIMVAIAWKAALLSLLIAPTLIILKPVFRRLNAVSTISASRGKKLSASFDRVLRGIVIVKANSAEKDEIELFSKESAETARSSVQLAERVFFANLTAKVATLFGLGLCVAVMLLVLHDDIRANASMYLIYLLVLKRSADVLQQSSHFIVDVESLAGIVDSINEVFASSLSKYELKDGTVPFNGVQNAIEVENLSFTYLEGPQVLHDISFTINRGEVVAFVGPSGSGKSTVAQLLLRLYDAPRNKIRIDGVDISEFQLQSLRERTAYVSQSSNLFDDTLRKNLLYGVSRNVSDAEIIEVIERAKLETLLARLPEGLETRLGDRGLRISGGEAQRVAIARAMLKDVDFFILDEATSALDATTEQEIQAAIDALVENKTVLVIAHRFSTLKNADRVVAMADGRIVEEGSLAELLEQDGLFAELWRAQELRV